jgi:enolase
MPTIESLSAMEILDSRGRPTVSAALRLRGGPTVTASVPSGASTGAAEALELRDGDSRRYGGLGVRKAVANVNVAIAKKLVGREFGGQAALDRAMIDLDGTPNKSRLGANAILAVSIAFARACAAARGLPLYQHFADMIEQLPFTLPRLTVNLFSGGKHAGAPGDSSPGRGSQVPIQDVLIVPATARSIDESLATVYAVYQAAAKLTHKKYASRALKADEGGLAPPFESVEQMLDDAMESINAAAPERVVLAVDVASSQFYADGFYHLGQRKLDAAGMIDLLRGWTKRWPIVSIEDGLAEDDWQHWPALCARIGQRCLVLGDDLLCTSPQRITRAVTTNAANALLLKVNQVGTLTEAAEARRIAKQAGWRVTISARSGETEDNWLADLAVGWGGDQIKVGSICQSERLAKYNRLLAIEKETTLPIIAWPA